MSSSEKPGLLSRLALDRPELRAWALYDWANSAVFTVIVTAVFPIYYRRVAAAGLEPREATARFALATTICLAIAALISPVLGAVADFRRTKKRWLAGFLALGVAAIAGLATVGEGEGTLALWLFGAANVGVASSFVFYDALLPHVAREGEVDQLSTSGYALGYLGGGVALALCVALISRPDLFGLPHGEGLSSSDASLPARIGFGLVAAWWAGFSVPLFLRVREPEVAIERDERAGDRALAVALARLRETFAELRGYRDAFLLMVAFLVYNDGIGTIIRMAAVFGEERAIDPGTMLACILLVQFVGIPFTLLFGRLARAIGPKRAILIALVAYGGITLLAYAMDSEAEFIAMACGVGMVQGGAQALSRSLFASLVPKHKSGEFFGLFATLEKFAGVVGPYLFVASPSSGGAVLGLLAFFVVGALLLARVDVERGRAAARAAERRLVAPAAGAAT